MGFPKKLSAITSTTVCTIIRISPTLATSIREARHTIEESFDHLGVPRAGGRRSGSSDAAPDPHLP